MKFHNLSFWQIISQMQNFVTVFLNPSIKLIFIWRKSGICHPFKSSLLICIMWQILTHSELVDEFQIFFPHLKKHTHSLTHLQALRVPEKAGGLLTWHCLLNYVKKKKIPWEFSMRVGDETLLLLMTHDRIRV